MRLRNIPGASEEMLVNPFVIQNPEQYKGHWSEHICNGKPLYIEIGMGKGQFIMALAAAHPDIFYIGIERYSSVLLRALQKMEQQPLDNVLFIRMDASTITDVFGTDEVERIYLNFSDPWPKDRHAKRRLTSKEYFQRYDAFLKENGQVEFKTDNRDLFDFSLEQVPLAGWRIEACTFDLHHDAEMNPGNVMTEYEEKFSALGNPIHKMIVKR
jgi:tRNA (guanine-N7-)-methyltransferase